MNSRRIIAIIAPILVVIIVIVPLVHEGYFNPIVDRYIPISVRDGHENVTYSGDFNDITNTEKAFNFSTSSAVSTVELANHPDSYLNVNVKNGSIFCDSSRNTSSICFAFSISGHFVGLHPYSMTLFFAALGPNQQSLIFGPGGGFVDKYQNVSPESLGYFRLEGPGNVSVPVPLLNDSGTLHSYNFYLNLSTHINVKMAPGSSHLFEIGAQVNGLNKPIVSTVNMTMVEKS